LADTVRRASFKEIIFQGGEKPFGNSIFRINNMKTLVCTNVLDNINSLAYGSHMQEWFRMGRNTQDEFILFHPNRFSIDNARNQAANFALQNECDYIYFIDDDMILAPNTYSSLKSCNADVAMALSFIRGYPFHVMAFIKNPEKSGELTYFDDLLEHPNFGGVVECEAIGFACALIKMSALKKVYPPYFITSTQSTEDIYFCIKLKRAAQDVRIVVDTRVPTGHLLHPEMISLHNFKKMKAFHAPEKPVEIDRGKEYLEQCKSHFLNPSVAN